MKSIETIFSEVYAPLVDEFVTQLEQRPLSDYKGIPHEFLPAWGKNYEAALIRLAIVGKETRGWSPCLDQYIHQYRAGKYTFEMDRKEFQDLDFRDPAWMGGRPTRASFWGFWMNVLAKTYGVENWNDMKYGEHGILLDSFVWGNMNSIETPTSDGVDASAPGYWHAKNASRVFDSIELLAKVFRPHVVILTCSEPERRQYMGESFDFVETVEERVSVYSRKGLLVFYAPHPNNQRWFAGGADVFARIIRDLLVRYRMFCPLPNVLKDGLSESAREILIRECRGIDTFSAIAKIAHELRKQHSCMTAKKLCLEILNPAGHTSNMGEPFTGNRRGPCKLVASAWYRYHKDKPDIAEDIALSFTTQNGRYAYE